MPGLPAPPGSPPGLAGALGTAVFCSSSSCCSPCPAGVLHQHATETLCFILQADLISPGSQSPQSHSRNLSKLIVAPINIFRLAIPSEYNKNSINWAELYISQYSWNVLIPFLSAQRAPFALRGYKKPWPTVAAPSWHPKSHQGKRRKEQREPRASDNCNKEEKISFCLIRGNASYWNGSDGPRVVTNN